jgi:hypothetical protein
MQHDIDGSGQLCQVLTNHLAHAALDAVTLHRAAKHLTDRETDARPAPVFSGSLSIESGNIPREAFSSLPVHELKIRMFQQP